MGVYLPGPEGRRVSEGGVRELGRPPPFEPQVYGENIAAGRLVERSMESYNAQWLQLTNGTNVTTHKSNYNSSVTVRVWPGRAGPG